MIDNNSERIVRFIKNELLTDIANKSYELTFFRETFQLNVNKELMSQQKQKCEHEKLIKFKTFSQFTNYYCMYMKKNMNNHYILCIIVCNAYRVITDCMVV